MPLKTVPYISVNEDGKNTFLREVVSNALEPIVYNVDGSVTDFN